MSELAAETSFLRCATCDRPVDRSAVACPHCGTAVRPTRVETNSRPAAGTGKTPPPLPVAKRAETDRARDWKSHFDAGLDAIGRQQYDSALTSLSQALLDAPDDELAPCYATRGYAYLCLGDCQRAVDECTRALDRNPRDGEALAWRGSAFAGLRQWRRAIEDYGEALRLTPEHATEFEPIALSHVENALADFRESVRRGESSAALFHDRGVIYSFCGQYDKAVRDFTQALGIDDQNIAGYLQRAECYAVMGEPDKVLADCTRAIELGCDDTDVFQLRGTALRQAGRYAEASADLTRVIQRDPQRKDAYFARGQVRLEAGEPSAAIADFSHAIERGGESGDYFIARGSAWSQLGDHDAAVRDFSHAISLAPAAASTLVLRGQSLFALRKLDEALADYDQAVQLDPVCVAAYCGRGRVLAEQRKFDEAIQELNKAERLDGRCATAYSVRGNVYFAARRYEDALAQYSRALELTVAPGERAEILYRRAVTHLDLKQAEPAIHDFDESIRLRDNHAGTLVWRARTLAAVGRFRAAIDDLNRAIRLNPADAPRYRKLGQPFAERAFAESTQAPAEDQQPVRSPLDRAVALEFCGRPADALADLAVVLQSEPDHVDANLIRAEILVQEGQDQAASEGFSRVLAGDSQRLAALEGRAGCYRRLGEVEPALADLKAAIKLAPKRADLYVARGELFAVAREPDRACNCLSRAIELNRRDARPFVARGRILAAQGRFDDAVNDFSAALQLDPSDALTFLHRGQAQAHGKRFAEAVRDFEEALRIDPRMTEAYTSVAICLARRGQYDDAMIYLTKALAQVETDTQRAILFETRAKLNYSVSRFHRATSDYTLAMQLRASGKALAPALYGQGLALFQLDDLGTAERCFAKALRVDDKFHPAETALAWVRGDLEEQPAELQPPPKNLPPTRPPVVRQPLTLGSSSDDGSVDPLWDQWIVYTASEAEFGPVTKAMLDQWCAEGRLDEHTMLLRADWDQWRSSSELYPGLLAAPHLDDTRDSVEAGASQSPTHGRPNGEPPELGNDEHSPDIRR